LRRIFLILILSFLSLWVYGEDLFTQTIAQDISTARYQELVTWLAELDLGIEGDIEVLRNRLADYYKVTLPPKEVQSQGELDQVTIDRADYSEYYTIPEKEENYLRLLGSVSLSVTQSSPSRVHKIQAQEVLYNQQKNFVFARGQVEYTLEKEVGVEKFSGERLLFDLNTWSGEFLEGGSESQIVNDYQETLDYFYVAETIKRTRDEVIILEDIIRSSSLPEEPYYRIKASKVWILTPEEWAIFNAVLYLGEVPVFYFPFYFKPGDDMFFNPVVGTDSQKGFFFNSTYYIYGRKTKRKSSFSFLEIQDQTGFDNPDDDRVFEYQRHGLYLQKGDAEIPKDDPRRTQYWKIYGDISSRVTASMGSVGIFKDLPYIKDLKTFQGIAFAHPYNDTYQIPFETTQPLGDQPYEESWFLNTQMPFRYLFTLDVAFDKGINLTLETAGDPDFAEDFLDRRENFEFLDLLGFNDFEEDYSSDGGNSEVYQFSPYINSSSRFSSLDWRLQGQYRPKIDALKPFVSTFSLSSLETSILWSYKDNGEYGDSYFYPNTSKPLSLSASMAGRLFPFPLEKEDKQDKPDQELIPPWSEEELTNTEEDSQGETEALQDPMRAPEFQKNLTLPRKPEYDYWPQLSYNLRSNYNLSGKFVDPQEDPGKLQWDHVYQRSTLDIPSLRFDLSQSLGPYGSISNRWNFQYKEPNHVYYNDDETIISEEAKKAKELADYRDAKRYLTDNLKVKLNPLPHIDSFTVNYDWSGILFERVFDPQYDLQDYIDKGKPQYQWEYLEFNDDKVTSHKFSGSYRFSLPYSTQGSSLGYSRILPPLESKDSLNTDVKWAQGPLALGVTQTGERTEDKGYWTFKPVTLSAALSGPYKAKLSQNGIYSWEEGNWESAQTTLGLGKFSATYLMLRTNKYNVDLSQPGSPLVKEDKKTFIPDKLTLSLNTGRMEDRAWKNRLAYGGSVNFGWNLYLNNFISSRMTLSSSLDFSLHDFLDFSLTAKSSNALSYRYIPYYYEKITGSTEGYRTPWEDIALGFQFFDENKRRQSAFKLDSIGISMNHYMPDWVLSFTLNSKPVRKESSSGWEFSNDIVLELRWKPHEEFHTVITDSYKDGFEVNTRK